MSETNLCDACQEIFVAPYDLGRPETLYIRHTKWTFITSISERCQLCRIICHSLYGWIYVQSRERTARDAGIIDIPDELRLSCSFDISFRNPEERNDRYSRFLIEAVKKSSLEQIQYVLVQYNLSLRMNVWNEMASEGPISLFMYPLLPNSLEDLMQSRLAHQHGTASDENFELISRWLKACTDTHSCSVFEEAVMPTRVIDVQENRLVEPGSEGLRAPYIALSHCWGSIQTIRTTSANYEYMMNGFSLDACPTTFQDAFKITARLGYRYIWIDALCIIQDSQQDWMRESQLMSGVYGHCDLNLLAAHAENGSKGCFSQRDILSARPCKVPNPFQPSANQAFIIIPKSMDKIYSEQITNSPLYSRAWILQERLLSPRSVYFGKEQIFWACNELAACEAFPNGANYNPTRPHNERSIDKKSVRRLLNPKNAVSLDEAGEISEAWARIVKVYSRSRLTFAPDKVVALSGIAERAQYHIRGQYIAGLWRTSDQAFLRSLLWFAASHDKSPRKHSKQFIAPSWSWMSNIGAVEMTGSKPDWKCPQISIGDDITYDEQWMAELLSVRSTGDWSYGTIPQGDNALVLKGVLTPVFLTPISEENVFAFEFFDAELHAHNQSEDRDQSQVGARICACHIDDPSSMKGDHPWEALCLPIIEEKEMRNGRLTGKSRIHGLLLRAAVDVPDSFERCGHFATPVMRQQKWINNWRPLTILII